MTRQAFVALSVLLIGLALAACGAPVRVPTPTPIGLAPKGVTVEQLEYVDAQHGWALIGLSHTPADNSKVFPYIQRTQDGGQTWESFAAPVYGKCRGGCGDPGRMSFAGPKVGWYVFEGVKASACIGTPIFVFKTEDGGATWELITSGPPYGCVTGLDSYDDLHGWMTIDAGWAGWIYATQDGGKTWRDITPKLGEEKRRNVADPWLKGSDDGSVWLEPGGYYQTIDGGESWRRSDSP